MSLELLTYPCQDTSNGHLVVSTMNHLLDPNIYHMLELHQHTAHHDRLPLIQTTRLQRVTIKSSAYSKFLGYYFTMRVWSI